jgi:Cdc6-like AAA superfamily ATPase
MFCPGDPGAGKSVITGIVVEELHRLFLDNETVAIGSVFCVFNFQDEQGLQDVLAKLPRQLITKQALPNELKKLYKETGQRPSLKEMSELFQKILPNYERTFIIIDALDECQASFRDDLLTRIFELHDYGTVNIFATARNIPAITGRFSCDTLVLPIKATESDMEAYVDSRMARSALLVEKGRSQSGSLTQESHSSKLLGLRAEIRSHVISFAEGS